MASVVNIYAIQTRFVQLGWNNINVPDVVAGLTANAIAAAELIAYLDALIATPGGMNDQTITGCAPADANKITSYLKTHNAVTV